MKILLLITLCLISGPVGHSDVIGYSGGRVMILSELQWDLDNTKSIFKMGQKHWDYIINKSSNRSYVHTGRFMLFRNAEGFLRVLIRNLKLEDTGTYRIGVGNHSSYNVNLDVRKDPCYGEPRTMTTYRGQNISIICNYPLEFKEFSKYIYKEDSDYLVKDIRAIRANSQKSRFLIYYDRSAEVLGLNISDVREADGGVYLCGVMNSNQPVLYYSFFSETRLHITGSDPVIISVSVSVALLLFGGFALILYILIYKRTRDSACSPKKRLIDNIQIYENDLANLHLYENTVIKLNCQNLGSFTSQSDSTYQRLDPLTNQSDSGYASLTNTTDQSHSHYQCLDPRTRTNSIYHTLGVSV
ncbi:hypothetical protein KOW79_013402 [Hemibagrus wyckioides]|uniref:Immunoglobulin domain-containing protein n=1 Tax=Hemibagrus wyckioides TaxID=337641 RepID=A0A9D3NMI5_9TELE|nr:uncharacterized protein LOC131366353 [Hemibagrus wyckioides]KAG7323700.1 hypothetical protein KOW79_013402 [Hemibagrus wyckioides]